MQRVVRYILSHFPHQPTAMQESACLEMVQFLYDPDPASAFVLRGYAGTGKTSLVSALVRSAPALRIKTVLLAPTGRAAKVLSGYSGQPAYTIHRKIYQTVTDSDGMMRVARALNKHSYTLFIVDEASMIGQNEESGMGRRSLLEDLVDYVTEGNHCRLMLIGDTAQLPPVGSSQSPALDLEYLSAILQLNVHHSELTEVVRQRSLSGILLNATMLRMQIAALPDGGTPNMPLFDLEDCEDVRRLPGEELVEVLNREYGENAIDEVAIITRSNKRANLFNQEIRNRILYREEEVNAGDYLMVVKNNQDCKLLLETLHSESPSLTYEESQQLFNSVMEDYADMPRRADRLNAVKQNPYYNALQVKFSYALTCHKTQGGQWGTVIIDQGYMTDEMVDKEYLRWLYTAVTRATERVYLLNFQDKFFEGENNIFNKN